jgi:ABC-type nitrate/sulfonate/bicarbonate transport system substrate-binding protein
MPDSEERGGLGAALVSMFLKTAGPEVADRLAEAARKAVHDAVRDPQKAARMLRRLADALDGTRSVEPK